jgi:hypothetical protein
VKTFAVGLTDAQGEGLNQDDMDSLAVAGGTERAYFIHDGATAAADLLAALNVIRGKSVGCDFPIPAATTAGERINPSLVNVTYTSGDGVETDFTKASDPNDCADSSSWYFDDDDAPTRVHLCPAACELVSADSKAHLRILAGCAPVLKDPR